VDEDLKKLIRQYQMALNEDQALQAVEEIVRIIRPRLFRFISNICPDKNDAEDLVQDVLWKVFENLKMNVPTWYYIPWIFAVARNVVRDEYRKPRTRLLEVTDPEIVIKIADAGIEPGDDSPDARLADVLLDIIKRAPEPCRTILTMRWLEGHTIREIATQMGKDEGAVQRMGHRCLESAEILFFEALKNESR
jgi:RNA polymerase sigma-70 factor (ECF subfamily)